MAAANSVLVLTTHDDDTADAVIDRLLVRKAQVQRIDTGDFPSSLRLAATTDGRGWTTQLTRDGHSVHMDEVGSIYYRRPTRFRLPDGMSHADQAFAAAEARLGFGGLLACIDGLWVNRPSDIAMAEYKPLQLQTAIRSGLAVPDTLISNDLKALAEFASQSPAPLVCKTFSSLIFSEGEQPVNTYTTVIDPDTVNEEQFAATAHLVQRFVPKALEARVVVVGREPVAVAIRSDSQQGLIDWRADYASLKYELISTPAEVRDGMSRYMDHLGLNFGAFDFVITPDDEWIMLECNPGGQWLWLEHETGAPIAAMMADLLIRGTTQ